MNQERFYKFRSRLLSSTVQAELQNKNAQSLSESKIWGLVKGNYSGIEFPITFKQEYGKNWTDMLDTGWPGLYLISTKFKGILESHHFTGWKAYPIRLLDKKSNEILDYCGFSVIGQSASIDYKKSPIIEKQLVPTGPICRFYKGLEIHQWDGSDFFCPGGNYGIYVTQRVEKVLKVNKVTNLRFEDITESEIDIDDVAR